jgi:hypothetical protein
MIFGHVEEELPFFGTLPSMCRSVAEAIWKLICRKIPTVDLHSTTKIVFEHMILQQLDKPHRIYTRSSSTHSLLPQ